VGTQWADDLKTVYVYDIDSVLFQEGGNKLERDKKSNTLVFPSSNAPYSEPHVKLRKASVYVDSLIVPPDLEMAIIHSRVMKQAFRKKRVRYSVGVNLLCPIHTRAMVAMFMESFWIYPSDSLTGLSLADLCFHEATMQISMATQTIQLMI